MTSYKIVKKGIFEKESAFEAKLNLLSLEGWRALSIAINGGYTIVLMEKSR